MFSRSQKIHWSNFNGIGSLKVLKQKQDSVKTMSKEFLKIHVSLINYEIHDSTGDTACYPSCFGI